MSDWITQRMESLSELTRGPEGLIVRVLQAPGFSGIADETGHSIGSLYHMALQRGILLGWNPLMDTRAGSARDPGDRSALRALKRGEA